MYLENTIRKEYNILEKDNLYISGRFYKKDSNRFCVYFVHSTDCVLVEFIEGNNRYNPIFKGEIWSGKNNGRGEFAPEIRKWTGKNYTWKFEKDK